MNYEIISIGDARFLADVLNAVAMIFQTGSTGAMMKMGLILSVIVVLFQGLMKGGSSISVSHLFISAIIINGFLVPKVNGVKVIDSYSGYVSIIDNVPIGVAFTGTAISAVGYKLTQLFEVAYQPIQASVSPKLTKQPFLESLKALNGLRESSASQGMWSAADTAVGGGFDMRGSWITYVQECTYKKITIGASTMAQLFVEPYRVALQPAVASGNDWTALTINGVEVPYTCNDAYTTLMDNMDKVAVDAGFAEQLTASLGVRNYNNTGATGMNSITSTSEMLLNAHVSAAELVKMSMLEPILYQASAKVMSSVDQASAIMINEARQKRNLAWVADQTLFNTIARPAMSFFEAFCYAVTPIMAFVMTLGPSGLSTALKYFSLNIWVQLWLPMMSIVNYFLCLVSSRSVSEFSNYSNYNFDSFYSLNSATDIASNWISVGGMLGAAVPALALMLLYGGATTANAIAGRLRADTDVNTNYGQPSASNAPPITQSAPMNTMTPGIGGNSTAMSAMDFSVNGTASTSAANSQLLSASVSEAGSVLSNLQTGINSSSSTGFKASVTESVGSSILANRSSMSSAAQSSLESFLVSNNADNSNRAALATQWAQEVGVSGSLRATKTGKKTVENAPAVGEMGPGKPKEVPSGGSASAGGEAGLRLVTSESQSGEISHSNAIAASSSKDERISDTDQISLAKSVNEGLSRVSGTEAGKSDAFNKLSTATKAFNKSNTELESFTKQGQVSNGFSSNQTVHGTQLALIASQQPDHVQKANNEEFASLKNSLGDNDRQALESTYRSARNAAMEGNLTGRNAQETERARESYAQLKAVSSLMHGRSENGGLSDGAIKATETMGQMYNQTMGYTNTSSATTNSESASKQDSISRNVQSAKVSAASSDRSVSAQGSRIQSDAQSAIDASPKANEARAVNPSSRAPTAFANDEKGNVKSIGDEGAHAVLSERFAARQKEIMAQDAANGLLGNNPAAVAKSMFDTKGVADSTTWTGMKSLFNQYASHPEEYSQWKSAKSDALSLLNQQTENPVQTARSLTEKLSSATHDNSIKEAFNKNPEGYTQYLKNSLGGQPQANVGMPGIDKQSATKMVAGAAMAFSANEGVLLNRARSDNNAVEMKRVEQSLNSEAIAASYVTPEEQKLYSTAKTQDYTGSALATVAVAAASKQAVLAGAVGISAASSKFLTNQLGGNERFAEASANFKISTLSNQLDNPRDMQNYVSIPSTDGKTSDAYLKNEDGSTGKLMFTYAKDESTGKINDVVLANKTDNEYANNFIKQTVAVAVADGNGQFNNNTYARVELLRPQAPPKKSGTNN